MEGKEKESDHNAGWEILVSCNSQCIYFFFHCTQAKDLDFRGTFFFLYRLARKIVRKEWREDGSGDKLCKITEEVNTLIRKIGMEGRNWTRQRQK